MPGGGDLPSLALLCGARWWPFGEVGCMGPPWPGEVRGRPVAWPTLQQLTRHQDGEWWGAMGPDLLYSPGFL